MHMADALLAPAVAGTMYLCSGAATGYSIKKVRALNEPEKIPTMGVMGAFVFAAQMINFTIPGTGSSGHLCGGMLLSAILGPCGAFLTMIAILAIQCLLFADGGLLALGCNVWNMAFYGCFIGGALIWRAVAGKKMTRGRIMAASVIGSVVSLQMGAFSVTVETLMSGITELPFAVFAGMMQPIHLAIGLAERVITASVLMFIHEARPEALYGYSQSGSKGAGRMSRKGLAAVFAAALIIGSAVSLFASGNPDGLEWSIEKVAGTAELSASGGVHRMAEKVQEVTAALPDYAFKSSDSAAGTSFSGIVGGVAVLAACFFVCMVIKKAGKGKKKKISAENLLG